MIKATAPGQAALRQGFLLRLQRFGVTLTVLGRRDGSDTTYAEVNGILEPLAAVDPSMDLGYDPRELTLFHVLRHPPFRPSYLVLLNGDRITDGNNVWKVVRKDDNPSNFILQYWLVKVVKNVDDESVAAPAPSSLALSGIGSPVGSVTPQFIGQLYTDTSGPNYWYSTALTSADWTAIISSAAHILSWTPPESTCNMLTVADSSEITSLAPLAFIAQFTGNYLTALSGLQELTGLNQLECNIGGYNAVSALDLSSLTALGYADVSAMGTLASLVLTGCTGLSALAAQGNILSALDISTCASLTTLDLSSNLLAPANAPNSVDDILHQLVLHGLAGGIVNLSGTGNDPPTDGALNVDVLALQATTPPWTVTTN